MFDVSDDGNVGESRQWTVQLAGHGLVTFLKPTIEDPLPMLELRALGGLTLQGAGSVQPKRLALLCYLALGGSRGFHRRDNLLALFWPELDESHARQSLRQALAALRTLDNNIVVTRGDEEVCVAPGGLGADVLAFEEALRRNALVTALEHYTGPFLLGFFLTECARI